MHKKTLLFGSISGAAAVALGAMGAHLLGPRLGPANLQIFETAVRYQMYHSLAMLTLGFAAPLIPSRALDSAAKLFMAGILLFSGSLYFLALRPLMGVADDQLKWIGAITPLGGMAFIAGWICLFFFALKLKK
jgi:uncharacterized membrane protein YgdD (TMEM256/DUF423 family)